MDIQQENNTLNRSKCMKPYTKHQLENWKGSDKIVVCENEEQLNYFIENAKKSSVCNRKLYFGIIPDEISERIEREFQVNIKEYNCSIRACEIRKILKSHGNVKQELDRGQKAVTELDFRSIPEIIVSPDKIEDGGKYHDKNALKFTKGDKTVVGIISRKHLDLYVQTMYIRQKK